MKYLFAFLIVIFGVLGCEEDVKNKPLTENNVDALKEKNDVLTDEEKGLLAGYLLRTGIQSAFNGEDSINLFDSSITISEAIERQKQWIINDSIRAANEKKLAEEELARKEAKEAALRNTIIITLLKKEFIEYEYQEYNVITYAATNKSDKTIKGFKGTLALQDMFGDPIISLEIKYDDPIKPDERVIERGVYEYNKFIDRDKKFRYTEFEKIETKWNPEMIIFEDGTKMSIN